MNKNVWELYLSLKADINWIKKELKWLWSKLETQSKQAWQQIWKSISEWIQSAIMKIWWALAIFEWLKKSLDLSWTIEQNIIAFETLLGSTEKAYDMIEKLTKFAKTTPFELIWLQKTAKQLIWMGFTAEQVIPTLKTLWDAISAVWWWEAELNRVVRALVQIKAKWKLSAEEVMQLAETGLPVYEILQQKLRLTAKEMGNLWNAGIQAWDAIQAIMEWLQERYEWMMEAQSKSFKWMLSNLKDSIDIFLAQIWNAVLPTVKNMLDWIIWFFNKWWKFLASEIWKLFSYIASLIADIVKIFKDALSFIWKLFWESWKQSILSWKKVFLYLRLWIKTIVLLFKEAFNWVITILWNVVLVWKMVWKQLITSFKVAWKSIIAIFTTIKNAVLRLFEVMINWVISWINFVVNVYNKIWDKVWLWLTKIRKVNWSSAKEVKDVWNWVIDEITFVDDFNDSIEEIKTFNSVMVWKIKDDWDLATSDMIRDIEETEKAYKIVTKNNIQQTKSFKFNLEWLYKVFNSWLEQVKETSKKVWNAMKKIGEKTKNAFGWVKEIIKTINNQAKNTINWIKKQIWLYDKITEKIKHIRNEYIKRKKEAHNTILEINNDLKELNKEKEQELIERYNQLLNELNSINKKEEELRDDEKKALWKELLRKKILREINDLQKRRRNILKEISIIKQNTPETVLKEAQEINKLTEAERILLKYKKERIKIEEKKWIYEAIKMQKWLLNEVIKVEEKNWQIIAKYFNKQKKQWIQIKEWENIQLAIQLEDKRKKLLQETKIQIQQLSKIKNVTQNLVENLKEIWNNYHLFLKNKTKLITNNILNQYNKIKEKLNEIMKYENIINQKNIKWFFTGWYTGWNNPLKPAWIVHEWEYVIPKWLVDANRNLINSIEKARITGTTIQQKEVKVNFDNVIINRDVDFESITSELQWRLWFII